MNTLHSEQLPKDMTVLVILPKIVVMSHGNLSLANPWALVVLSWKVLAQL